VLLYRQAQDVEWAAVWNSVQALPTATLLGGVALTMASYMLYSCFDLLGRHHTGHHLPVAVVLRLTFISYAFNLNLGSLVGGVAFRYRLYQRLGLELGQVTRIMALSMATNWLGYLSLAGAMLLWFPFSTPARWGVGPEDLRLLGLGLMAVVLAYPALCASSRRRIFHLRGHTIELPSWRLALLQTAMGAGNWLLMGSIVHLLIPTAPDFPTVMAVLLLAAMAGVLTHVPAGMGVLEAVFIAWLSPPVERHELLAALLAYRLMYYLVPLGLALMLYIQLEAKGRTRPNSDQKPLHG
jgi:hypothetical protein